MSAWRRRGRARLHCLPHSIGASERVNRSRRESSTIRSFWRSPQVRVLTRTNRLHSIRSDRSGTGRHHLHTRTPPGSLEALPARVARRVSATGRLIGSLFFTKRYANVDVMSIGSPYIETRCFDRAGNCGSTQTGRAARATRQRTRRGAARRRPVPPSGAESMGGAGLGPVIRRSRVGGSAGWTWRWPGC
jgi:hypothetical protein